MNLHSPLGASAPEIFRAAVRLLLYPETDSAWNSRILENEDVSRSASRRRNIIELLEQYYRLVPDVSTSMDTALSDGLIDEATACELYELLTVFLVEEECSDRLLLYLPFELIPEPMSGRFENDLRIARDAFVAAYLECWNKALERRDIRADFVDGDIPEAEMRSEPLPLVVKAAHLVPILIRKGLLTRSAVERIMQEARCETLRQSLSDTLSSMDEEACTDTGSDSPARSYGWLAATVRNAQDDMSRTAKRIASECGKKPEARIAWEIQKETTEISQACSRMIANTIRSGRLAVTDLSRFLIQAENQTVTVMTVAAAYLLMESEARIETARAQKTYLVLKPAFEKCWREGEEDVREELRSLWLRLMALDVLREQEVRPYGLTVPTFDDPDDTVLRPYVGISDAITMDAELSMFLLPIVIAGGSQIKGYGTDESDIDFAVFVRPGVRLEDRDRIDVLIGEALEPFDITSRPLQFWLQDDNGYLRIRDFGTDDRYLGTSVLTHLLFACPWIGDRRSVTRLYEKLLTPYLTTKEVPVFGERTRSIWLEELESSALLYRLLHKGYLRTNPERRSSVAEGGVPDSRSAFWDSGYRRVASLIFLRKVFLPYVRTG